MEFGLQRFLAHQYGHVSYERVVSGAGLGALYDFFAARAGREPEEIAARLAAGDRNAVIAELGLARAHAPAADAVDLFARIYGAEAGNVALRELALGGVYVVGNIGRIIVPARREIFLEGFRAKGRSDVRAFYDAAMAAGGRDNGPPGLRAVYHPSYYGAFVLDPDGHNIEAVCHDPYLEDG